jgi:L-lactate dehydrogenase complex protein LldG
MLSNGSEETLVAATTTSRRAIMDRLESRLVDGPELPEIDLKELTTFDDPLEHFCQMVQAVGGQPHRLDRPEDATAILEAIPVFSEATRVASLVPEIAKGNVDVSMIDDPHALATLDWTIVQGDFAVAENGAIWIDGDSLPQRVMLFIAQYLAIVVSGSQVVSNMHEAYERVGKPPHPFGIFVAGPSKTADIEQSLVLGAHGCRALQVFITP